MESSNRKALLRKMLDYEGRGSPARQTETALAPVDTAIFSVEKTPVAPPREADLLKSMLTEQQTALRKALQSSADSEKAAGVATVQLVEIQKELRGKAEELARERMERQRAAVSETQIVTGLQAELAATSELAQNIGRLRDRDRRLFLTIAPGVVLAMILIWVMAGHRTVVIHGPASPVADRSPPPKSPEAADPGTALERLNSALGIYPSANISDVLRAADHALIESGSPPCSLEWAGGAQALVVSANHGAKKPLTAAFTRCAAAVEQLRRR